jgi:hypothetical protein
MVVVATWPLLVSVQRWLGTERHDCSDDHRDAARIRAAVLGARSAHSPNTPMVGAWTKSLHLATIPPPPARSSIAFLSVRVAAAWRDGKRRVGRSRREDQPLCRLFLQWIAGQAGTVGMLVVQFLLTIIISAVARMAAWPAAGMRRFGHRLARCTRGEQSIMLAGQAIRGVALGVVGGALVSPSAGAA